MRLQCSPVLATCGIRSAVEAFENTQSRLLLHVLPTQIRGGKGALAKASDHPPLTGDTACLYQNGRDDPGSSGAGGSNLETSPVHC
jgi:hypothetical protein